MLYCSLSVAATFGGQIEEFDLSTLLPLPKQGHHERARHV